MKRVFTLAVLAAIAAPVAAQTSPAPTATPMPAPTGTAAKFTLDTPVQEIVADTRAKAVLDADLPGISSHPSFEMFKSMSLAQLQAYAPDKLTAAALTRAATDLAAIR